MLDDDLCVLCCRCEPVGGDRERSVAAGSKRSGESLLPHQQTEVSADGCVGRTQRPDHYIRYMYCRFKYTKHTTQPSYTAPYIKEIHTFSSVAL